MVEQKIRVPSPAKAAIAQQKPRDAAGRFLSGAELEAYRARQQQSQFAAERDRMSSILGRTVSPASPQTPSMPGFLSQPPNSFEAIIQANKPRGMATDLGEQDKWDILLGKKRRL